MLTSYIHSIHDSLPITASLGTLTDTTLTSAASSSSISKKVRTKRRVSLHNDVAVIPIPSRTEYCTSTRERLWSSPTELYQNAARNAIEFASEGFDWRNVADDSQMVRSPQGERIHPIHYMNIQNGSLIPGLAGATNQAAPVDSGPCQTEADTAPVSMDTEPVTS